MSFAPALEPEPPIGYFGKAFFLPLMKDFMARRASTALSAGPLLKKNPESRDSGSGPSDHPGM